MYQICNFSYYRFAVSLVLLLTPTSCAEGRHNIPLPPVTLTFDLLTMKVVSESRVMWANLCTNFSLPGPLCCRLRPDVHDRQTDVRHQTASSLDAPA